MLRECIQTVEEVNGGMDEGQPRFLTTVLTCEGDLQDPSFPNRLESLVGKLNRLISQEKEPFCVEKVEPWNSVRVTFTIPWDAALRLRELAQQGDQVLRDLGILSVQIEGDQVITLTLANRYSEPQELVFKTSTNADASSESSFGLELPEGNSSSAKTIGHLLSKAIKTSTDAEVAPRSVGNASSSPPEETAVNGSVAFQSPNVVAPSSESPPPFKTNAAALMSQKSYTQNPVSSGPFPFASMTYAMNTKHAAANSQSTKHIQGSSARFPFTPPLQRSASSAWMPYVSQKNVASSSSAAANIASDTKQPDLLSTSPHQNQHTNVEFSNASSNIAGELKKTVAASRTTKANNVLSSPLLVNLLQSESSSRFPHSNVSPALSPIPQPPAKRKRKPRKKEENVISRRTSRSDVINCHSNSLPMPTNSAAVAVSQSSSVVTGASEVQSLGKTLSPYFPAPSPEEQTFGLSKSRSPLYRENSVLPNNVPFQSFPNSNFSVRSFQTAANSLHDGESVTCTSASSAMDHSTKISSPADAESKKLATDGSVSNCTPFPSPPPSADGKVKHLINPFTGHLEPMPSDDEEDDECIGSLSLFPELEMMDTNDGADSDKTVGDKSEGKQNLQKVPVSECMQDHQINADSHRVRKHVIDALMYRKPDVYTVNPSASSLSERNYSFARMKNINPSDLSKVASNIQVLGGLPKELKKTFLEKDVPDEIENLKVPVRSSTPTTNGNSPLPAQVSQVDLSFLQPHLQNWKSISNKGKSASIVYSSNVKPRVAENLIVAKSSVKANHQENIEKLVDNRTMINCLEKSKYSYNLFSNAKSANVSTDIVKGSHTVSDSFYALKPKMSEHNSNLLSEISAGLEKPCSNVDSVNLAVKEVLNTSVSGPAVFFNKLTVLDAHNVDRANNTLKQVFPSVNTNSPKYVNFRKLQVDEKAVCYSRLEFHNTGAGKVESYGKDAASVIKSDEINTGMNQSAESLVMNPIIHEADSSFSNTLGIGAYSSATSYDTCLPSVVVSSCDRQAVMTSRVNSLLQSSPVNSDIKEFKSSPLLERHVISPESNPHFETPPDSRSPISSISSNDRLSTESVNSFDVIHKETLFNPGKHGKFLAEMMDASVKIQRHNENNSEQCSMSSLINPNSTLKPEISMHKKSFGNIPLCETPDSNKAIFSVSNSYSGSEQNFTCETEKSQKKLLTVLNKGKSDQELNSALLSSLQNQSKSDEPSPVNRTNSSFSYLACSDELKKSGATGPGVSHSSISYQSFDDTSLHLCTGYGEKDSADNLSGKLNEQEGHFTSGSITKSSKSYDFMDNNISKPPEQLPLEIFENSESESQSPASSLDGESHTHFAGKDKQGLTIPSTVCGPNESRLSSQDHFSNASPSDSSEKNVSVSSPRFVSHEVLTFETCQEPLVLFGNNLSDTNSSELTAKCSVFQTASDRVNSPLSCVASKLSGVCARGSATTTSVANVPSSVSLSVPTDSMALPKTRESARKFANGSVYSSRHVDVSHSKNVDGQAALEESFKSSVLENSAFLYSEASAASSQTGSSTASVKHCRSKKLTNSSSQKIPDDDSIQRELQSSSQLSLSLKDNYPLLTSSADFRKTESKFSTGFEEDNANGYAGHVFMSSSRYDNGLGLNISNDTDSKLHLSRSREIDPFTNYNSLAQKLMSSVDDKLVSEIKCKLNISRDLKLNNKISSIDSSFPPDLQHTKGYENNNCVTIVSAEELHSASKKSNRSYSEDSFGDSSVESPYRNSDPLELEYNMCDYKFDSVDRSLRPKHRNGSTCLIEDEVDSPSEISGSLLFASASDINSPNTKMMFQSTHEKMKALNGRKDVNAACAIVEIRNASLFDGTKLLNPRKKCILSPRIGGEEQLQGIKRRRLSADSLR